MAADPRKRKLVGLGPEQETEPQGDRGPAGRFVEGSILRITMHNFLTYDHCEVYPGPNLNMIIGANGTGKSSIVCAICLGLAGKTATLGRGDKVGLYVKRGCTKGSVEIELYRAVGNLVIFREMQVQNNQSTWTINGEHASQRVVEEAVKALRIQVGNLCQFLPQEKVGEFAKMSKVELLEATEKSVGPPEMYEIHCELKTFRSKERELENICKEKASFLEKAKQRNERNRQDVQRYYEKKRHLDRIKMLERKKPWVEYETSREQLEAVKREREQAKRELRALKEEQAPMLFQIQSVDARLKTFKALVLCHLQVEDIQQALSLKQMEEDDRQKRISNTRCIVAGLQAELDSLGKQEDVQPQINQINVELRGLQEDKARLESRQSDLRREKESMRGDVSGYGFDMMKMKEEKLRNKFRDTYDALQWLRQNRSLFEGNVHEPMMLVINVRNPCHAKYIESHIPANDLRAFVFQRQEDMERFMKEVRDSRRLRVNAVIAPCESFARRPPGRPLDTLKQFGFFSYLRELFDAPEEVMSYLCYQYKVHEVPVGTEKTKEMIEEVRPVERMTATSYRANCQILTGGEAEDDAVMLHLDVPGDQGDPAEDHLHSRGEVPREEVATLQEQQSQLDRRDNELLRRKKMLSEMKGKKRQLEQKISAKQDSLIQMEQSGIDLRQAEQEACTKTRAVNSQKVAIVTEFGQHIVKLHMVKVYLALEIVELSAEKARLESSCREATVRVQTLEQKCKQLDETKTALLNTCHERLKKAKETCNIDPRENGIPEELKTMHFMPLMRHSCDPKAFSELPNTLDEIDAWLNEERSRAECFTGLSSGVVEEYTRRSQEIENLSRELEEKHSALETYQQNISQAKEQWLNPLRLLVEQINEKFSDFFYSMQCAGEVDLHSENEEEYDRYGIRIRVKFRSSTQLHELTPHHQSGGERSVSTMLYLMALQELNRCPFRVVDEINQGMDPVNERRVFDIVVRTACSGTTSQYFFITPKLLPNLQYADEMTVLCVHNGPQMLAPTKWNEKAFLRRARRRQTRAANA
uniref:Structural maintenance of chromosomes protein 5 n=1 Tax=Scleropages formosus TaxID=113540 RepID=A0A8C9TFA4_SCLFO